MASPVAGLTGNGSMVAVLAIGPGNSTAMFMRSQALGRAPRDPDAVRVPRSREASGRRAVTTQPARGLAREMRLSAGSFLPVARSRRHPWGQMSVFSEDRPPPGLRPEGIGAVSG